ncbi:MAG: aldehyde dehydrogenase family protein [Gammaproteobacteria bacterium]|nr:aldehyde dehydrogenase family protein [Gammaproteobacteria bacterium]
MIERDRLFIDGCWVEPAGRNRIEVIGPADGAPLARIPEGTTADVEAAVGAARRAFADWAATPVAERAAALRRIHAGLKARADEIGETISREMGMPLKLARRIQAGSPIAVFGYYAELLGAFPFEERAGHSLVVREPVGVVAAITPWNYPLHQISLKVAPALAAACTVVLKPSELAPLNAFILAEVAAAAGLPPGVFNLVTGYGPVVGEALASHREVDMVSFTGSTAAGRRVSELAAATIKRVALELGGKSAAIVLDDADLAAAVRGTLATCCVNCGQTCSAHTRLLVPEARYAEAAQLAATIANGYRPGDPLAEGTTLGPLVSARQRERVLGYMRKGIEEGAELLAGGPEPPAGLTAGWFVRPTVFGRVRPGSTLEQEEIFGPVLSIITYRDEDEAVTIANDTSYGLAGGVWSADLERAIRVARRLRTGQVDINGAPFNLQAPFGGCRQSGNGRELGRYGLEEYLEYKAIQLPPPAPQT